MKCVRQRLRDIVSRGQCEIAATETRDTLVGPWKGANPRAEMLSLDVIYEAARHGLEEQQRTYHTLSDSARTSITAASIVTGVFSAFPIGGSRLAEWQIGVTLVLWVVVAMCALMGFKLEEYRVVPDLAGLAKYSSCNTRFTKHKIFEAMIQAYQANQESLKAKTCWAGRSQRALFALVIWMAIVNMVRTLL